MKLDQAFLEKRIQELTAEIIKTKSELHLLKGEERAEKRESLLLMQSSLLTNENLLRVLTGKARITG